MKDLGAMRYFLGLEIDKTAQGIFVSQRKYTNDLFKEHEMHRLKPLKLPMDPHVKITADKGSPMPNPDPYRRLVG